MKKLLLTLAVLCGTVSGWADVSKTVWVKGTTGVFNTTSGSYAKAWGSNTTDENPFQLILSTPGANNINRDNSIDYVMINSGDNQGTGAGCTYTISVPNHFNITGYSFKCSFGSEDTSSRTITAGGKSYTISADEQLVEVTGLNVRTTSFVLSGYNKPVKLTEFSVTVSAPDGPLVLEDGYYTFQSVGGEKSYQFANYIPDANRIVPVTLGRYNGSVYQIKKGEGNKYTIQTYDGKYVTYDGTSGDNVKIKLPKDATNNNKW